MDARRMCTIRVESKLAAVLPGLCRYETIQARQIIGTRRLTRCSEHGIEGEALVALKHDELKEMGIASVGHRLTILKSVYDIKINQDIPVEPDDYVPPSESAYNQVRSAYLT